MSGNSRSMALIIGFSLLVMAILAGFGYGYAFNTIYVSNNQTATLKQLSQFQALFRGFIFSFLLILMLDILVAWASYIFFQSVDEFLSLLSAWFRLVYAAMLGISFLSLVSVLPSLNSSNPDEASIMQHLQSFLAMWSLSLIVFGVHLVLLGCLILKSGYIPKIIGYLTLLAAICYLGSNVGSLLFKDYALYKNSIEAVLSVPMAIGELGLAFWLLFRGGKTK